MQSTTCECRPLYLLGVTRVGSNVAAHRDTLDLLTLCPGRQENRRAEESATINFVGVDPEIGGVPLGITTQLDGEADGAAIELKRVEIEIEIVAQIGNRLTESALAERRLRRVKTPGLECFMADTAAIVDQGDSAGWGFSGLKPSESGAAGCGPGFEPARASLMRFAC